MIIDIHDVWDAASHRHELYVRQKMRNAWERFHKYGPPEQILAKVHTFVQSHEAEIVSASTRDYTASTQDYDRQFLAGSYERQQADTILEKVFNYDAFRDATTGWNAYALCATSPYKVCPYCHLNSAKTQKKDSEHKGYRFQLDHFITRTDYPFLALSIGNLVPSCGDCNGPGMKHTTKVLTDPHLSPLVDAAVLTFQLRPKDSQPWSPMLRALRVPLDEYEIVIETPLGNLAAENSLRTFQLTSRYQSYLHDAYRIAKIDKNHAWLRTIATRLRMTPSVEEQLGFPMKNKCTRFKNVPQGKMRMDVYTDSRKW